MPELSVKQQVQGGIGQAVLMCGDCKSPLIKKFCGRHDLVYYACRCPFKPNPMDPYHQDHSGCRR